MFQKVSRPSKCHSKFLGSYTYMDTNTNHITPARASACRVITGVGCFNSYSLRLDKQKSFGPFINILPLIYTHTHVHIYTSNKITSPYAMLSNTNNNNNNNNNNKTTTTTTTTHLHLQIPIFHSHSVESLSSPLECSYLLELEFQYQD